MKLLLIFIASTLSFASSYKILGVFPFSSKSHYAIGEATMLALHEAGHEVTMISVHELKKPIKNYRQIKIVDLVNTMEKTDQNNFNAFKFAEKNPVFSLDYFFTLGAKQVEHVMTSENVLSLMNSGEKFDAVVVELFLADALLGFGQHFGCPVIGVNTFDGVYWNDVYTGNQSPYSYVPMIFLAMPKKMSYSQRLSNTIYSQIEKIAYNFYHLRKQQKLYEKYFPKATKPFDEVHKSLSILFTNSHVSSSSARPMLPNMIEIGGIHVQPVKPLPKDIKSFLDSANDGVILFSMGSFVLSTDWTLEQREAFVKTFSKLKQKVLWKYENETLPGNPGNIMIGSWIPQRDIVAHPNVKLFITHGGNLGTTEALSEGVPLLGIPLFGDQKMNMERAVGNGYALTLDYQNITVENFSQSMNELLTNPKYDTNAKRLSRLFKDRPMTPKATIVFWTEHVIRQDGAHHLKNAGLELNFIEFHLIDIYATLLAGAFGFLFVAYQIIKFIFIKSSAAGKQKKQ